MNKTMEIKSTTQLREFLDPKAPTPFEKSILIEKSSSLIETILSTSSLKSYEQTKLQLSSLYENLKTIFDEASVPMELRERQFLNKTGFAMSPLDALTTINDVLRVSGFIRSIDKAIEDLKKEFDETLHIVYPACGPLAPLLMPLLAFYQSSGKYTSQDICVTLIDVQEGAVLSLEKLFNTTGLSSFVKEIVYGDAVDYEKKTFEKIHMVILEAMQHGFTKEGHLAIAMHFSKLLDEKGIFLPQKISIEAVLGNGQEEFVEQFKENNGIVPSLLNKEAGKNRIKMGTILEVSLDNIENFEILDIDEYTKLVRCASLKIPSIPKDQTNQILLFCSKIEIYKGEMIDEYDSGITHPLPDMSICINFIPSNDIREEDLYVNSGDTLEFFYRLNGLPGFLVMKSE